MEAILQFLYGATASLFFAVGFFFLRYWYAARDRLYLWFMLAFWAFATSWSMHLVFETASETGASVYVFRVIGFLMIIVGIIDKNRSAK